jgi:hypothetical protein
MKYRRRKCRKIFTCPNIPVVAGSGGRYGHGLMCWCVYHNIVGKQSMLGVLRGLQDIFNLNLGHSNMYRFKTTQVLRVIPQRDTRDDSQSKSHSHR